MRPWFRLVAGGKKVPLFHLGWRSVDAPERGPERTVWRCSDGLWTGGQRGWSLAIRRKGGQMRPTGTRRNCAGAEVWPQGKFTDARRGLKGGPAMTSYTAEWKRGESVPHSLSRTCGLSHTSREINSMFSWKAQFFTQTCWVRAYYCCGGLWGDSQGWKLLPVQWCGSFSGPRPESILEFTWLGSSDISTPLILMCLLTLLQSCPDSLWPCGR